MEPVRISGAPTIEIADDATLELFARLTRLADERWQEHFQTSFGSASEVKDSNLAATFNRFETSGRADAPFSVVSVRGVTSAIGLQALTILRDAVAAANRLRATDLADIEEEADAVRTLIAENWTQGED